MMEKSEKRNSTAGMKGSPDRAHRAGGRQPGNGTDDRGGGYPDVCSSPGSAVQDPRLGELREIGLGPHWMRVAREIGVDNFLVAWMVLTETAPQDDHGRVVLPSISNYLRHQRNKYIITLSRYGSTAADIRQELRSRLGYDLTERHIKKLIKEGA